jgi:hypothetical protein
VRFGDAPAPITSDDARTLVTAVPPNAASGPITVTTPLGGALSPLPFEVLTP